MRSIIAPVVCAALLLMSQECQALPKPPPSVHVSESAVTVTSGDQRLTARLSDASLELRTPCDTYHFNLSIQHDAGWITPSQAEDEPEIHRDRTSASASMSFPVADERELVVEIEAYNDIPAIFVISRLRNLGAPRSEYYFWMWDGAFDHYFAPGADGPEQVGVNTRIWNRFRHRDWLFLPAATGGLAVLTNGIVGRAQAGARQSEPGNGAGVGAGALPLSALLAGNGHR